MDHFVTPDLGLATFVFAATGQDPEVMLPEGSTSRAVFRFRRDQQVTDALSALARNTPASQKPQAVLDQHRQVLRARAIACVETHRGAGR